MSEPQTDAELPDMDPLDEDERLAMPAITPRHRISARTVLRRIGNNVRVMNVETLDEVTLTADNVITTLTDNLALHVAGTAQAMLFPRRVLLDRWRGEDVMYIMDGQRVTNTKVVQVPGFGYIRTEVALQLLASGAVFARFVATVAINAVYSYHVLTHTHRHRHVNVIGRNTGQLDPKVCYDLVEVA